MVTLLYQSLCNMERSIADHVAIRYYDEDKTGRNGVYHRQYARDLRSSSASCAVRQGMSGAAGRDPGPQITVTTNIVCTGTVLAGGVAVPLNMGKNWDEIQYELDLVEPVCVLQDGGICSGACPRRMPTVQSWSRWMPLRAFAPAQDVKEVEDLAAMAFIMFTSGTTGRSKGRYAEPEEPVCGHARLLDPFDDVRKATGWDTDKFCSLLRAAHVPHLGHDQHGIWSITSHCISLCNDLKYFYRDIGAMHSEVMAVVPVLLKSLYKDVMKGRRDRLNGLCVLTCGASYHVQDPKMLKGPDGQGLLYCPDVRPDRDLRRWCLELLSGGKAP